MNTTNLEVDYKPTFDDLMLIYAIQFCIAAIGWVSTILSLNRFRSVLKFTRPEVIGGGLYIVSGLCRAVAALATKSASASVQAITALMGSGMSWAAFIIIFNDSVALPSKQQVNAILLAVVTTGFWELQNYIVLHVLD